MSEALSSPLHYLYVQVPATANVVSALRGDNGVFKYAKKNTIIVDCSTIDPIVSKELSGEALSLGLAMVDAPVSGGVTGAEAGTLTFMVGGEQQVLDKVEPLLLWCVNIPPTVLSAN